jgi:hypothetical protein
VQRALKRVGFHQSVFALKHSEFTKPTTKRMRTGLIMIRTTKVFSASVLAVLMTGIAHAFPTPNFKGTDPNIGSPGYPDFWAADFSASLTANSQGSVYTLSIQGSNPNLGIFNFPNAAYTVGNEQVKLTAHFDSSGNLLTSLANTYEIDGSLQSSSNPTFGSAPGGYSWAAQPVEKLFSAQLTAVTVDSKDEALGFLSTNFGGWANQKQFTGTDGIDTESVWLYSLLAPLSSYNSQINSANSNWNSFLAQIKNHSALKANTFYGIASIATVPLPAAILLFCSSLLGLGGLARHRAAQPQPA